MFIGKYIFKWWIFHCHVSFFLGGTPTLRIQKKHSFKTLAPNGPRDDKMNRGARYEPEKVPKSQAEEIGFSNMVGLENKRSQKYNG